MDDLHDLDAAALLAASSGAVRDRRSAEVRDLQVLAQWAYAHGADPTLGPDGGRARRVGDVLVEIGGEGTPQVQDFCLGEIALARGTGVMATRHAIADVLDLIHRLPGLWRVCLAGDAEVWVARRVAKLSRHLPIERVGVVDAAISQVLAAEAPGRVIEVAEATIISADPDLHEQRTAEERRRRYVAVSRTDEAGLRTVIARIGAGDAAWVDATVSRVADVIAAQHPDATRDQIRALAFGWLARPADLLRLLLEHTEPTTVPETHRATAFPADLLEALSGADLSALTPRSTLYVHLHEAVIHGAPGVARAEGIGPVTLARLAELLRGTEIAVKPVIDLTDRVRTTAYEHPASLKERIALTTGGDYWPYAVSTSRAVDYDHPTPYVPPDQGGPPGQTGSHNSGPLGRRHHKWKTHAGYSARQSGQGRYIWTTPHGLAFEVDHRGSRSIDPHQAQVIIDAPRSVDIYFSDFPIDVDLRADWAASGLVLLRQ